MNRNRLRVALLATPALLLTLTACGSGSSAPNSAGATDGTTPTPSPTVTVDRSEGTKQTVSLVNGTRVIVRVPNDQPNQYDDAYYTSYNFSCNGTTGVYQAVNTHYNSGGAMSVVANDPMCAAKQPQPTATGTTK